VSLVCLRGVNNCRTGVRRNRLVILSEAKNPKQRALPSCPSCNFVETKKTPDGSPARQSLRGTPVPPASPTLGRHGSRRDANRAQCLFLLLLFLEESNQRTLRNRNARFNRRPACHRFRCVRSVWSREADCTLHRNLTASIEASLRTPPPIPRGAGFCCGACWCRGVVHDTPET
jgi:hypothetical protein